MSTSEVEDLLSPDAAAEELTRRGVKVTGGTIRRWAKAGWIRHLRLPSGQLWLRREDVEALLTFVEPSAVTADSDGSAA